MRIRISARQSDLARLQAKLVGAALKKKHQNVEVEFLFRESLGDKNLTDPLWKIPEKGVFTEDFYQDLVLNKTDLVVHSWKDLPTEGKPDTSIVATLPREDQRDLLLFKKSSLNKSDLRIYSSSPRRIYNLKPLLPDILPWSVVNLEFQSVRGNIQTRVRKMTEDTGIDGLVVAKAAMDRLLSTAPSRDPQTGVVTDEFEKTRTYLRGVVDESLWMVLPLSQNPTAAAQGALAIEILNSREDLKEILSAIHCEKTFQDVLLERNCLKKFGGGCHLALGMSAQTLTDSETEVLFVKGMTPDHQALQEKNIQRKKNLPPPRMDADFLWSWPADSIQRSPVGSESARREIEKKLSSSAPHGFIVSRAEAWPFAEAWGLKTENLFLWTAGLQTWKKLAQQGFWVCGTFDGLGDLAEQGLSELAPRVPWQTLTHADHPELSSDKHLVSYQMSLSEDIVIGSEKFFYWRSGSQFLRALSRFPQIKEFHHACGPGSTARVIKQTLPELEALNRFWIFLSEEDWRKECQKTHPQL